MLKPSQPRCVMNLLLCGVLLVATQGCEEPTGPPPAQGVYPVPSAIDATGGADVTEELMAFFATVPDTSVIVFPDSGQYRIEGTLRFADRHGLTIEGNGSLFFATVPAPHQNRHQDRTRSQWHLIGGSDLLLRDVRVRGANPNAGTSPEAYVPDLEAQHGFDVWGVQGLTLERVEVTDVFGDFVYISNRRDTGEWSSDVLITHSHFERNGRQGIAIAGARRVVVEDNYIGQTRRASIDLEPYNRLSGMDDIAIRSNTFGPGRLMFIAAASSTEARIENLVIEKNVLNGKTMNILIKSPEAHPGVRHRSIHVRGNVTDKTFGSPVALMRFIGVDGLGVHENHSAIAPNRSRKAVEVEMSCSVNVSGNDFPGAESEVHMAGYVGC